MTKQVSTAVLAIIVSLFPIGNSISPPVALAQTPPQVECLENETGLGNSGSSSRPTPRLSNGRDPSGFTDMLTGEILRQEDKERERYTQESVKKLSEKFPDYNIVISHKGGKATGDHVTHKHCELNVPFGRTKGYEIHLSPKGKPFTFVKDGDGGFQNWRYEGDFEIKDNTLTAK